MPHTSDRLPKHVFAIPVAALTLLLIACSGPSHSVSRPAVSGSPGPKLASAATTATAAPGATGALSPRPRFTENTSAIPAQQVTPTPAPQQPRPVLATPPQPEHAAAATARELLGRDIVPTTEECLAAKATACFTPAQVRAAYNVDPLLQQGIDGSGQSVVIIVSFGSPTLIEDVAAFSKAMGLPEADVQQLYPLGTDFKEIDKGDTAGWGGETTLDAEWVHAIAPRARIVVLVSPVSETEGVDGLPEFLALERYALDNQLGTVISQSWGTSENLLEDADGESVRAEFDAFYQQAIAQGITVVTASGDHGALGDTQAGGVANLRAADWPSAVPWITTVGGTILTLNADGGYGSERVLQAASVASGSGISRFYHEPAEQQVLPDSIQLQLGGMRGEADVSAIGSGLLLYFATGTAGVPHPGIVGGTSASAPVWAGIVALANQAAGKGLGNINPALYSLGATGRCFHDVTIGDNHFRSDPGEPALPGWDLPTGWGTPDVACLVPELAKASRGG